MTEKPIELIYDKSLDLLKYEIKGFSKSDIAYLYEKDGKVICETRYNQIDEIDNYDDLVMIAFSWYERYSNRDPFKTPSSYWIQDFLDKGLIKTQTIYQMT